MVALAVCVFATETQDQEAAEQYFRTYGTVRLIHIQYRFIDSSNLMLRIFLNSILPGTTRVLVSAPLTPALPSPLTPPPPSPLTPEPTLVTLPLPPLTVSTTGPLVPTLTASAALATTTSTKRYYLNRQRQYFNPIISIITSV